MTGPHDPPPPRGRASPESRPLRASTASATAAATAAAVTAAPLPLCHKQTPTPAPRGMQSVHADSDVLSPLICPATTCVLCRRPTADATTPPPPAPLSLGNPPVSAGGGVGQLMLAGATVGARRARGGVELAGAGAAVAVDALNGAAHSTAAARLMLHVGADELPRWHNVEGGAREDRHGDAVPRMGTALKVDAAARRQQKPEVPVGKNLKHRATQAMRIRTQHEQSVQ